MVRRSIPLGEVYRLLEPGPVVLVTSAFRGKTNVMTMSWHTMMEFEPPLVGCVISDANYSFRLIERSQEFVINIPTVELARTVVGVGNTSGATVDKFDRFHLTKEPATCVGAPLLSECYASLECKVVDRSMVKKYDLFIVEVLKAWIRPMKGKKPCMIHHCGKGAFVVDGPRITLRSGKK